MTGRRKLANSLLGRADAVPPFLAWALARVGKRGPHPHPTPHEIAKLAGLSIRTFHRIASRTTWKGIEIDVVDAFLQACRINVRCLYREKRHIKRQVKYGHFQHMNNWQQKAFEKKLVAWQQQQVAAEPSPSESNHNNQEACASVS